MKFNHLLAFLLTLVGVLVLITGIIFEILQIVLFDSDCSDYSILMFQEETNIDTEVGKGNLVKLVVINTGSYTDSYEVEMEGPEWSLIKPTSFTLKSEESKSVFLYVSPDFGTEGKYEINVDVKSKCVHERQILEVNVF